MAKPLTQKQLKAELKKAEERLAQQRTQLASLEQTYAGLTGKPSPLTTPTDVLNRPSALAAQESGAIGAASIASRAAINVPAGSPAAIIAEQAKELLDAKRVALENPMLDPYYKRNTLTGLSPAQAEAKKAVVEAARISGKPIISAGFGNTPIVGGTPITTAVTSATTANPITTSIDVLKSLLRGMGFNSSIIDSSTSFLMSLLKDGLDYDNAVAVFLNSKDYTLKSGQKIESPFYAEYGIYNEGLVRAKSAAELYNAVEGYKEISAKYNLNSKFTSKDYMRQYIKNNVSVAQLDERANTARLKAVNADPAYLESLRRLGFLSSSTDLTDFFLDPKVGQETLEQNRATAAFSAEAIRRAGQGITFDAARFGRTAAGLVGLGLNEAQIGVQASEGFENIAQQLAPTVKLEEIYNRNLPSSIGAIQQELEAQEFQGLASERRKRLREREAAEFSGQAGTARGISLGTYSAGRI